MRLGEQEPTSAFRAGVFAAEWIGAGDGAACGRATQLARHLDARPC